MAPAQYPEPTTAAPAPVLTCHDTASTATRPGIHRTRETAPRGPRRGLRAIIAISRSDPAPPYEGPPRPFTRRDLGLTPNGLVLTVASKARFASLEAFHQAHSDVRTTDYLYAGHRFLLYQRPDVEFEVVYTPDPFGVQTESIDGRQVPRPVFESNQIDVAALPFMAGDVARNVPFFPWGDSLEVWPYHNLPWILGSRGLADEVPYSRRLEALKSDRQKSSQ